MIMDLIALMKKSCTFFIIELQNIVYVLIEFSVVGRQM